MEELLSPREFIKRFHLPQLVRISTSQPPVDHDPSVAAARNDQSANHATRGQQAPSRRPEQRDSGWTYSSAGDDGESGSKSLHFADSAQTYDAHAQGPVSLSGIDAVTGEPTAARLLPRVKLLSRITGESFNRTRPLNDQTFLRPATSRSERRANSPRDKTSIKLTSSYSCLNNIKLMPPSKRPTLSKLELEQPFLIYKAHRKLEICAYAADSNNQLHDKSGEPIYFPHNYQGWFSIRPTTRAFDKSAQKTASDTRPQRQPKNEDNEGHLETLDQVCQAGGQVFLTRDELIGYQLPSKLSHLTKLKNNQLLAVPLAINLSRTTRGSGDKTRGSEGAGSKKSNQKKGSCATSSINDLRQCVIGAGKVLRICGIYEDVLPLIESASKQQQQQHQSQLDLNGSKFHQAHKRAGNQAADQQTQWNGYTSHYYGQPGELPHTTSQVGHSQQQQQLVYTAGAANPALARRDQRLLWQQQQQHYGLCGPQMVAPPRELIYQNNLQQQQQQQSGQFIAQPPVATNARPSGKRYARCLILSDESVDQLTGCTTPGGATGKNHKCDSTGKTDATLARQETEVEVLIPLNLLGRFYLCATGQTIANELHCHDCSLAAHRSAPYLVFRLSQIVYLLNVNKRLSHASVASASSHQQQARSHSWRPFSSSFTLPLQVRLVMGPRPASFSPTMFGLSSTMESYFSSEHNVGGHLLACKFNRTSSTVAPVSNGPIESAASGRNQWDVCACAHQLRPIGGDGLGWFSGSLRLDSMAKRDVLLACTIKQSPLRHSDLIGHLSASAGCESTRVNSQQKSSFKGRTAKRALGPGATLGPSDRVAAKSSARLDELLETPAAAKRLGFFAPSDFVLAAPSPGGLAASASSKSSMSRLRACRSLISLNGRRQKKKRPDIPSSMLNETLRQLAGSTRDGATEGGNFIDKMGAQLAMQVDSFGGAKAGSFSERDLRELEPIILIELDCSAAGADENSDEDNQHDQLMISRTFVERSLPASSIPDLVVNRMNYCQAHSHLWERQLKLSQASLSRDFDACTRQLASLMARQANDDQMNGQIGGQQQVVSPNSMARQPVEPGARPLSMLLIQRDQRTITSGEIISDTRHDHNQTGGNLTASSRSSSGVSSSGEHHRAHFMLSDRSDVNSAANVKSAATRADKQPAGSCSTSSSLSNLDASHSASSPGDDSSSSSSSTSTSRDLNNSQQDTASQQHRLQATKVRATAKNSRLLRLVQKILPLSSSSSSSRSVTVVANGQSQVAPLSTGRKHEQKRQQHCSTSSGCDVSSNSTTLSSGGHKKKRGETTSKQQLKLMEELNGRFRSKLSLMAGSDRLASSTCGETKTRDTNTGVGRQSPQRPSETLMNAQKVHKRLLMTGSMRHLPSELLNRMMGDDDDDDLELHHERPFDSKSCTLNDDEDDSSHLYESLERLNSDCLQNSLGASTSISKQQVQQQQQQQHASHSSRLMMKIQLIKQQQQRRRQQQQQQQREPLCPERAPGASGGSESGSAVVARSRPGLGGQRQTVEVEEAAAAVEDEWWRQDASSGDDEAAARATSGCASGNARRPLVVLPSWRQRLVASVGGVGGGVGVGGQQRKLPTESGKRESRLCHSMELFGGDDEFDGIGDLRRRRQQQSCSDAESCDAGEQLDMEPVSIEACEQHASQGLSASDDDDDDDERPPMRAASDRACNRADNDLSSSSSFTSSACGGSSCSLTSARFNQQQQQQQQQRLIETTLPADTGTATENTTDCDIYVNLIPPSATSWNSLDELAHERDGSQTPVAEHKLEMSRRNLRLVGRMERKLAKLRGRKELPMPPRRRQASLSAANEQSGELRSLGWEPADELRARKQRIILANNSSNGHGSQSMICPVNETKPAQVQATQGGCSLSASSSLSRTSSSLSSSSSSLVTERNHRTADKLAESKVETTTTRPPVAHGNGGCQRGRNAEAAPGGGQVQNSGPRSIVTLDRPSAMAVVAMSNGDAEKQETNWTASS